MNAQNRRIAAIVMGPSGVGKTTTAKGIAERLGYVFAEADEFHPKANIDKMSAGIPLNDEDRAPWLRLIRDWITREAEAGRSVVVTCSALKKTYRDVLRQSHADVRFIQLDAPIGVIGDRMARRKGHYMPASLLKSQYDTLEPLAADEKGSVVSVEAAPQEVINAAVAVLQNG
jgi:gluconokinase